MEKARVTRVGIGRLYNLGNYEHIRYDLTIEIPEGADALDAVSKMRQILRALKPVKAKGYEDRKAETLLAMSPQERDEQIRDGNHRLEDFDAAAEIVARRSVVKAKREAALKLFNDLGGESVYTDHKEQWDDDNDW